MKPELKQIRSLSLALFVSGALNIFLASFIIFWAFTDRPPTPYCELKPKAQSAMRTTVVSPTNADLLRQYKALPYEQLVLKLPRMGLVEDGFTERDLAIGVLTAFHDFNLEKALGAHPLPSQKRLLSFDEGQDKVIVYPGLTEEQYEAIQEFARTEKWPFKTRGLLLWLKKEQWKDDPTLADAFYLTHEFTVFEELFKGHSIEREALLEMIQEGDWGMLSAFYEKQKTAQDLSAENRQRLLLNYLKGGAKKAAVLLLKTDFDFASKRLTDATQLSILRALDSSTPEINRYLANMAASPRGDSVKSLAAAKYQELTGKSWEPLVSRETVINKPAAIEKAITFKPTPPKVTPKAPIKKPIAQVPSTKMRYYIVQEGDSLWKIAKRFKTSIEDIRAVNSLKNDTLKPGASLKIPDRSAKATAR